MPRIQHAAHAYASNASTVTNAGLSRTKHAHCAHIVIATTALMYVLPAGRFKAGVWVGVELFEPRGRHNGTVNGVHYFDVDLSFLPKYRWGIGEVSCYCSEIRSIVACTRTCA